MDNIYVKYTKIQIVSENYSPSLDFTNSDYTFYDMFAREERGKMAWFNCPLNSAKLSSRS